MEKGIKGMVKRIGNAEERFIAWAMETADLSREQSVKALATYRKAKAIKIWARRNLMTKSGFMVLTKI